jgi:hypothetical protein
MSHSCHAGEFCKAVIDQAIGPVAGLLAHVIVFSFQEVLAAE